MVGKLERRKTIKLNKFLKIHLKFEKINIKIKNLAQILPQRKN